MYIVTDPKGILVLVECREALTARAGIGSKVLNTINFKKSMRYNPFAYLRSEKDILKLVNTIDCQHQRRRGKSRGGFLGKIGTALLLRPYRLHLVRSPGRRKELHDAA